MENDYRGELPPMKDYMPEGMSKEGKETFEKWYEEQKSKGVQFHLRQELEDYCIDDVQLLRKGCLTFQHYFCKCTRFCPFEQITIASACNRDLRLNRMEENTTASEPLCGWRLDVNHSKAAMEWLTFEEQQLRLHAWLACSDDERKQLDEISWKQAMIALTRGSVSVYSMLGIRANIAFQTPGGWPTMLRPTRFTSFLAVSGMVVPSVFLSARKPTAA